MLGVEGVYGAGVILNSSQLQTKTGCMAATRHEHLQLMKTLVFTLHWSDAYLQRVIAKKNVSWETESDGAAGKKNGTFAKCC